MTSARSNTQMQLEDWRRRLRLLQIEIEEFYGEASPGIYDNDLATKVRFAADEAAFLERSEREARYVPS